MVEYAIEIEGLRKKYGSFQLKDISFKVRKGTIMGLIGEKGAGKTTLIKAIVGAIHKDGGSIKLFGEEYGAYDTEYKNDIGVVFDTCYFPEMLKAYEIEMIFRGIYKNWSSELFYNYIDRLKLTGGKRIKEYSNEMKIKLSVAAALSHKPRLLLMDEAVDELERTAKNEILNILPEFIQGGENTVLLSSHTTTDIQKVCGYITVIKGGDIFLSDDKNMIQEKYCIVKCSAEEYGKVPEESICRTRKNGFSYEVLVKDMSSFEHIFRDMTVKSASFEDIVSFYR